MARPSLWYEPEVRQEFHLHIYKCGGAAWCYHCPEHHATDTVSVSYRNWETARDMANLHLRNYNHY